MDGPALAALRPDRVFDGGDLDCGGGLVLLLRENVLAVPVGGVLELRTREPTVKDDLPPWCRMVGHEYLGGIEEGAVARHFLRRGTGGPEDEGALAADQDRARAYEWRARVRVAGARHAAVYCRNHVLHLGPPATFEEKDEHPSALEAALGALAADLAVGFATACARDGLEVDDVESTVKGRLADVMASLDAGRGDPGLSAVEVTCFVTSLADEERLRAAWDRAVQGSPLAATLRKATALSLRLAIV